MCCSVVFAINTMINTVRFLKLCRSIVGQRRFLTLLVPAVAFAMTVATAGTVQAQEAVVASAVIKGRVANAGTGQFLENAVVSIDGTKIQAKTTPDGNYRFSNLPAGIYSITVFYTGLDIEKHSIEVGVNEEKALDFDLTSEVYVLGSFTVAAEREGSAKAIQQQRESDTMKSVVASDSFGNLVDGNIGELMKNLPGIAIDYDGEDAAKMRFRGMDPALMNVTVDGNAAASINGTDNNGNDQKASRSFSLKDMPVQNIETIEVWPAPPPDQPVSLGGSVNFVTKSAFNQKGRRVRFDANMSLNSTTLEFQKLPGGGRTPDRKDVPGFNFSYSEAFGKIHPLGVVFNANYTQTYRFNNSYTLPGGTAGYTFNYNELIANNNVATADMGGYVPAVAWTERGISNQRKFISLNLDLKASDSTVLFLKTQYSLDTGLGAYQHYLRVDGGSQLGGNSFDTLYAPSGAKISASSTVSNNNTNTWGIDGGVRHRFGVFEVAYDGFINKASNLPDAAKNYYASYSLQGLGLEVDGISGNATGKIVQLAGPDYRKLNNYSALSLYNDFYYGVDTQLGGKIDAKYAMTVFGLPLEIKTGGRFNERDRLTKRTYNKYDSTGGSTGFGASNEPLLGQYRDGYFSDRWDFNVPVPEWVSPYKVYDAYQANPGMFYTKRLDLTDANTTVASPYVREWMANRYSRERIYAGYAMGTLKPFQSLTVMGGARYEFTDLMARGYSIDATPSVFGANHIYDRVTPTSPYYGMSDTDAVALLLHKQQATKSYDKLFPNLQVKWEPLKDFMVRGSYSTNMGRPDLGNILPTQTIYKNYYLIKQSNPKLLPQTGTNYDLKLEYYLPKSGVLTAGLFHQDIQKFIYTVTYVLPVIDVETGDAQMWQVQQPQNAGKGHNDGVEFSYRQRLGFIAPWLEKFEFYSAFSAANPVMQYWKLVNPLPSQSTPMTQDQIDAYMNGPSVLTNAEMPGVLKKTANARISYNGTKFTATVAAIWRGEYSRSIDTTNTAQVKQAAALSMDTELTYKMSTHWSAYFDWRNFTNTPDERHVFNRTGGYFTSGMAINLGIRANL